MQFAFYDGHGPIIKRIACYGFDLKCSSLTHVFGHLLPSRWWHFVEVYGIGDMCRIYPAGHQGQTLKIVSTSGSHESSALLVTYHSLTSHML